ncbi:HK97-gp10 family putative phage morphogenesis protein [Rummeliibacillus stabekisii]|uniref:Uncharacterized protein n=1 Tax=Rummeliibacillus stabekisii TaxID=241244 RepID=A0A143HAU0_9BACL|nr:HK97-gp10 family putative phage morphogenesis protein [Rummeliibacillus stabekisii]AMW98451.1 hypothetical protein ATY39_02780 [Rummeliibacillus stabekisii]
MAEIDMRSVEAGLRKLAGQNKRVLNKAVRKASEVVVKSLEENTPLAREKSRDGSWKAQRQYENANSLKRTKYSHLRDDIVTSNVNQEGRMQVGFSKDTYWRAHFPEMGTINQKPQGFMEKTTHESQDEFFNELSKELKKGLGL